MIRSSSRSSNISFICSLNSPFKSLLVRSFTCQYCVRWFSSSISRSFFHLFNTFRSFVLPFVSSIVRLFARSRVLRPSVTFVDTNRFHHPVQSHIRHSRHLLRCRGASTWRGWSYLKKMLKVLLFSKLCCSFLVACPRRCDAYGAHRVFSSRGCVAEVALHVYVE